MKVLCTAQMGIGTVMGQTMRVVAIAKELQRRGHDIRFIAAGKLVPVISNFGIDVVEAADMPHFAAFVDQQAVTDVNSGELIAKMQSMVEKVAQIEAAAAAKEQPHLIISGTLSGAAVARQAGIPSILTFLQPHGARTLDMFKSRLGKFDQPTKDRVSARLLAMLEAASLIVLEGMPEISGGVSIESFGQATPGIKEKIRFSGPLLIEYPDQLPGRNELKRSAIGDQNKIMAYVTIGGGSPLIGGQFIRTVLDALRMMPAVTGVIATGMDIAPATIADFAPPANAVIRGFVPGTEMVKASDVTVFHGGSSTLMTCIACGTPAVVVPSMGEQEDNGAVLAEHGAGIVLEKRSLTPELLAAAMQKIITDGNYRTNAQRLKVLGEKYGGAGAAADWAEQLAMVASR